MKRIALALGLLLCLAVPLTGCADRERITRSEHTTHHTDGSPYTAEGQVSTHTHETVHEETTYQEEDRGGLLSGTIDLIGDIIALPFRIVGGLLDIIF